MQAVSGSHLVPSPGIDLVVCDLTCHVISLNAGCLWVTPSAIPGLHQFRFYTSKMNEICLHCHWLYFSSIIMSFGQGVFLSETPLPVNSTTVLVLLPNTLFLGEKREENPSDFSFSPKNTKATMLLKKH